MHSLLAPILAQLVTVGVGDRVEARYVTSEVERYFESSNEARAGAAVTFDWRRTSLGFGYTADLSVVPLEETPREISLYHTAFLGGEYRFRRTTVSIEQTVGYGERNYGREVLSPRATDPVEPPSGPDEPEPEAETRPRVADTEVRVITVSTRAELTHQHSRPVTSRYYVGYMRYGGADEESREEYPIVRGPNAGGGVSYQVDGRNRLDTNVDAQLAWSVNNDAFAMTVNETWEHQFDRRTRSQVGAGLAYARNAPPGEATAHSIYPIANAGIDHSTRLSGGTLTVNLDVSAAPVLDFTTGTVDPRLGVNGGATWTLRRFSVSASTGASISLAPDAEGSLSSIYADLVASYDLGAGFFLEAGERAAWQRFEGITLVEPSFVTFAALRWEAAAPIIGP